MRRSRLFFALPALLVSSVMSAQTTGDISGRVTDVSGSPLPGVTIEATSPSLPGARLTVTGRDGGYRIPAIPPGTYRIAGTLAGFGTAEKTCLVSLGSVMTVDLTMRIETEERVIVSGDAPLIDTTSTTTGTTYTRGVIDRLPVGRNYADIVRSNPGVSIDKGETQDRYLALAIYGATSAENQWIIDGVNTTDVLKGIQGKALSSEFVQEVEVKTGGYQAELGRALGGVINVVTKSGGNTLHGDAFVYHDSSDTVASRRFENGDAGVMRTVDSERLDYGADLGGYVLKDRLWFFGAYNRVTLDRPVSRVESTPTVSKEDVFPVDQASNLHSLKLTWNAAASTTVVGSMFSDRSSTSGAVGKAVGTPDPSTWYSKREQGGTDYGLRLMQLFGSQAFATIQAASHRDENSLVADDRIFYVDWRCAGGSPEAPCPFPPAPNSSWGGYGGGTGRSVGSRRQYDARVNLYAGNHELKAGGAYMDGRNDKTQRYTGGQFVQIFNRWGQTYYEHRYFAVSRTDLTQLRERHWRAQVLDYGAWLQDSWRVGQNLTVNAGVRWDGQTTRNFRGETVLEFDDEWQPRLGVAWDPWRDGATKIYASAGRFSYALPLAAAVASFGGGTIVRTYNFDPVSLVHDPNVLNTRMSVAGGGFASSVDEGVKAAYQDELTVGIERMLTPTFTVGLKGTYRRLGRALEDRADLDYNSPETDYNQYALVNPGSNGRYARGDVPTCNGLFDDPRWYQCFPTGEATPAAKRLYRGIELLARKSVSDRLWLQASYIYSSLRGNYDGGVNQLHDQFVGQTWPGVDYDFNYPQFWHNSYGALALDQPHRFRFDGYWTTPLKLSVGLQTWIESGMPLNTLGYFNSNYGASILLVPRGSAGRLPTMWEANLTLSYPVAIGPLTATLQAYLFNAFNNQIATATDQAWSHTPPEGFPETIYAPNQEQNNPNYGKVTSRSAPRSFRAAVRLSF